jgi:hypothetical protein
VGERPLELPPRSEHRYVAFVDASAGRHDAFCIAVGHREGERCIIDLVRGRHAPFDPETVAREYAELAKQYRCMEIVGDNFAGEWVSQAFKKAGSAYKRSDKPKSAIYLETVQLFSRGQLNLPEHPKLLRELRLLERVTSKAGRDRVDHPMRGSDDYANSACGALVLLAAASKATPWAVASWGGKPYWWSDGRHQSNTGNEQSRPCTLVFPKPKEVDERHFKVIRSPRIW